MPCAQISTQAALVISEAKYQTFEAVQLDGSMSAVSRSIAHVLLIHYYVPYLVDTLGSTPIILTLNHLHTAISHRRMDTYSEPLTALCFMPPVQSKNEFLRMLPLIASMSETKRPSSEINLNVTKTKIKINVF
jgi:hypothetical protein